MTTPVVTPASPAVKFSLVVGLSDIALVVIAVFVVLAYFNGWG